MVGTATVPKIGGHDVAFESSGHKKPCISVC